MPPSPAISAQCTSSSRQLTLNSVSAASASRKESASKSGGNATPDTFATRRRSDIVPNSTDIDSESDSDIAIAVANRRQLSEVLIPVMTRRTSTKQEDSASPTDTPLSSMASTRAGSMDYDTPGTTPATSVKGANVRKRKRSSLGRTVVQLEDSNEEMADADLALARRLQEEEYAQDLRPKYAQEEAGPSKRLKLEVQDSEEESELSELESLQSEESIPLATRRGRETSGLQHELEKAHKGKVVRRPAPGPSKSKKAATPVRKARANARTSIGQTLKIEVADSDSELGELSELESEDSFRVRDSEEEDVTTGVSDAESDVAGTSASAAATAPVGRPRKVRRAFRQRGRRFGRISAADAARMAEEIEDLVMSRKERERKKLEKAHPSIKTMWEDLEKIPVIKPVAAEQPPSINRKLKKFQLEGLDWLIKQEKTHYKGGLLGDEMGMGKTIQAVSLIMSDYPQKEPTLVVVPPVALMQWSTEIKEYTDGKLDVLVYHGQNSKVKNMGVKELKKFDVIMISYNSLESLHRKETKGWSRGDNIIKEDSPIHAIHFHRLILDEAHSIKSRTTGVAKACFALRGTYKWCLSGTPVQNRIGEFFSLLRFLEVRPFADYFCKRCPCSMVHWKLDDDHMCGNCKHSGMEHVSVFNQELLNPLTQSEEPEERAAAMDKLHMITARIMLRRMKRDHTSSMELPPKEVIVHNEYVS